MTSTGRSYDRNCKRNEYCEFDSDEMDRNYPNRFIIDATFMVGLRSFVIPFFI